MLHVIWYLIVGLIAGAIAKSVMQVHIGFGRTLLLGIVGSILGGLIAQVFSKPAHNRSFIQPGSSCQLLAQL